MKSLSSRPLPPALQLLFFFRLSLTVFLIAHPDPLYLELSSVSYHAMASIQIFTAKCLFRARRCEGMKKAILYSEVVNES